MEPWLTEGLAGWGLHTRAWERGIFMRGSLQVLCGQTQETPPGAPAPPGPAAPGVGAVVRVRGSQDPCGSLRSAEAELAPPRPVVSQLFW